MLSPRFVRWSALTALALAAACEKPREPAAATPTTTPPPLAAPRPPAPATAAAARSPTSAPAATPPAAEIPAPPPARLLAAYLATTDHDERVDLAHQLADAGAPGLDALRQAFQVERDEDLKSTILTLADTFDETHVAAQLALYRLALASDQPEDVRETALGLLLPVDDRRAMPLWQSLLGDADAQTREMAQARLEWLEDLPPE